MNGRSINSWELETPTVSSEDFVDAQSFDQQKRARLSKRISALETQMKEVITTMELILSIMDAEARMKMGIKRPKGISDD